MSGTVELYPSNWFYNASVIGFLEVMSTPGLIQPEKVIDTNGNRVLLDLSLFTGAKATLKLKEYLQRRNKKLIQGVDGWNKNYFPKPDDWVSFEEFTKVLTQINSIYNTTTYTDICGICLKPFSSTDWKNLIYDHLKSTNVDVQIKEGIIGWSNRIARHFSSVHCAVLGSSFDENPNFFWTYKHSIPICPLCGYLSIFYRFAFHFIKGSGYAFANSQSFNLMWNQHKFLKDILSKYKNYTYRSMFALTVAKAAIQTTTTLGLWEVSNIELVLIKERSTEKSKKSRDYYVDYYSVPPHILELLLNKDIEELLSQANNNYIFELILRGNVDELIDLQGKILHRLLNNTSSHAKKGDKDDKKESHPIFKLSDERLATLSKIIPLLYIHIKEVKAQKNKKEEIYVKY